MALSPNARDKIRGIVDRYRAEVDQIKADTRLSPQGRLETATELHQAASERVKELREADTKASEARQRDLRRALFGPGANPRDAAIVSYRDAQDRVAAIRTPEDLGELMERAHISDDELLLRAGFAHAWQQSISPTAGGGWRDLVDEYCDQYPTATEPVAELYGLVGGSASEAVQESIATSVPSPARLLAASPTDPPVVERPQGIFRDAGV